MLGYSTEQNELLGHKIMDILRRHPCRERLLDKINGERFHVAINNRKMSVLEVGDVCSAATLSVDVAIALKILVHLVHSIVIDSQLH